MSKKCGRPSELTGEVVEGARELAASVEFLETLAPLLGFDRTTIFRWCREGAKESRRRARGLKRNPKLDLFVQFCNAVKKGRAESEKRSLDTIRAAADAGQWQAAAWRLERGHPERWSTTRFRAQVKALSEKVSQLEKFILNERLPSEN